MVWLLPACRRRRLAKGVALGLTVDHCLLGLVPLPAVIPEPWQGRASQMYA